MSHSRSRRIAAWTMVAVATAIAWLLLKGLAAGPRVWAVLLLVPIPVAAIAQTRLIDDPSSLPRLPVYASTSIFLWLLAVATLLVGRIGATDPRDAGLFLPGPLTLTAFAVATTALGIASVFVGRWLHIPESPILQRLIPVSRRERLAFAGVSLSAGICEELVFRGYLLHWLDDIRGMAAAVIVTTVVFGAMHAYQEIRGAMRAAILGLILCIPPLVTGSVVPSMVAHAAIDLIAGLALGHHLTRDMA